jgi:hypothetical protein
MFGGKKEKEKVYSKAYVEKLNLGNVQLVPVPKDLENWIELDFDPTFNYRNKVYDVEEGIFIDCVTSINKVISAKRKSAYIKRSDPLFMEWNFDNTNETEAIWHNEILSIKSELPFK